MRISIEPMGSMNITGHTHFIWWREGADPNECFKTTKPVWEFLTGEEIVKLMLEETIEITPERLAENTEPSDWPVWR